MAVIYYFLLRLRALSTIGLFNRPAYHNPLQQLEETSL